MTDFSAVCHKSMLGLVLAGIQRNNSTAGKDICYFISLSINILILILDYYYYYNIVII